MIRIADTTPNPKLDAMINSVNNLTGPLNLPAVLEDLNKHTETPTKYFKDALN